MINNHDGYLYGMPVIIAEQTIKVRNKRSKIKFIDRLYEKIYGWSELKQSWLPEGTDIVITGATSGCGKVVYVRNREVLAKVEEAVVKDILNHMEG